jgi:hypothetical protein
MGVRPSRADRRRAVCIVALTLVSSPAAAHSFGQSYSLPVPIWMYLYGATLALIFSFLVVGYLVTGSSNTASIELAQARARNVPGRAIGILRGLSLATLALTIGAGFFGTNDPYRNISMTLFWVIFGLGFTYFTALAGDWFAVLNPFRVLVEQVERLAPALFRGRVADPAGLGYWPALLLYVAFIWIELFGRTNPFSLSAILSAYAGLSVAGCWLVGKEAWFERCEFLDVFLRQVARIAPVEVTCVDGGKSARWRWRLPFFGLLQEKEIPVSLLVFILFMLSSTAFDGLKETALWVGTFLQNLYQHVLIPLYGDVSRIDYATIRTLFLAWQSAALIVSPLVYLAVYAFFIFLAQRVTGRSIALRTLLLSFGYCLIPIALVYNVTHYYTLLQTQGAQMLRLISDPLGQGWNLFGTARTQLRVVPDLAFVWHAQVFLIVAGHVVSVYVAHLQALKLFPDRRSALLSQLPTLLLMVGFTAFGLWILSLPLNTSPVRLD